MEEYSIKSKCNAIEIVGHTDDKHITKKNGSSDLDSELISSFQKGALEKLKPHGNMDLGMMRALSVIEILKAQQKKGRLERIEYFFPYSSGQMILPAPEHTIADTYKTNRMRQDDALKFV